MIHIVSLKASHGFTHFLIDCSTLHLRLNSFLQKKALENPRAIPSGSDSFTKTRLQNNTDNSH